MRTTSEVTAASPGRSLIASSGEVRVLRTLRTLFDALQGAGVRYCHWKSNWKLVEALRGERDLDLLVHRGDASRFLSVVGAVGCKPGRSDGHPSLCHYYGFDEESGRVFDLHVYHRIITGGTIKEYHLPLESALLRGARPTEEGVCVPERAAERVSFVMRRGLDYAVPSEALIPRDRAAGAEELRWLGQGVGDPGRRRVLGGGLPGANIHGGKPPPALVTALPRLLLPLLRRTMPAYRTSRIDMQAAAGKGMDFGATRAGALIVYVLRALMVAYERKQLLTRAHRRAANGTLVVADRYPTRQPGVPDGPSLHFLLGNRNPLYRWLARVEERMYRDIPQPDLVFCLNVPLELAVHRNLTRDKPGGPEPTDYLRRRHAQSAELEFGGVPTYRIRTDAMVAETLRSIKPILWKAL